MSDELKKYMLDFGYFEDDIIEIINNYIFKKYKDNTLLDKIKQINTYLLQFYTKKEIIRMTLSLPGLYSYSIDNLNLKINNLIELGYSFEEIIKMTE